jgi:hypothetical protein
MGRKNPQDLEVKIMNSVFKLSSGDVTWPAGYMSQAFRGEVWAGDKNLDVISISMIFEVTRLMT